MLSDLLLIILTGFQGIALLFLYQIRQELRKLNEGPRDTQSQSGGGGGEDD